MNILNSKDALDMRRDEAHDILENLEYFLDELDERLDYFKNNSRANPTEQMSQMMLSMLIMMLDKLEAEGLFKPNGWRPVFDHFQEDDDFPDEFLEKE